MLLQDTQLIETLAHFSRERIPERTVHASGAGAWGEFEVTHDVSHLTNAKFLNGIGKKSKVLLRVSTVGPERGHPETVRDVRGWGMKIFTEEGNQDFVFNDIVSSLLRPRWKSGLTDRRDSLYSLSETQSNFLLSIGLINDTRSQIFRILQWYVSNPHTTEMSKLLTYSTTVLGVKPTPNSK